MKRFKKTKKLRFVEIPIDVVRFHIVSFLNYRDVNSLCRTCKIFGERDEAMWNILCERDWKVNGNYSRYRHEVVEKKVTEFQYLRFSYMSSDSMIREIFDLSRWGLDKNSGMENVEIYDPVKTHNQIFTRRVLLILGEVPFRDAKRSSSWLMQNSTKSQKLFFCREPFEHHQIPYEGDDFLIKYLLDPRFKG